MGNHSSSTMDRLAGQEKYVNDNLSRVRYNCNNNGMEYKYSDRQLKNKLREEYYSSSRSSTSNSYVSSYDWQKINCSSNYY